jgi:hypothetical protein
VLVGNGVPLRPADGAEDHGVGGLGLVHRRLGDRDPVRVEGGAADEVGGRLEPPLGALRVEKGDDALDFGHGLHTDAVARQQQQLERGHGWLPVSLASRKLLLPKPLARDKRQQRGRRRHAAGVDGRHERYFSLSPPGKGSG